VLLGKFSVPVHYFTKTSEQTSKLEKTSKQFFQVEEAHMYAKFQLLFEHFQK